VLRTALQNRRARAVIALVSLIALSPLSLACSKPDGGAIMTTTSVSAPSLPPTAVSESTAGNPGPNPTQSDPGQNPTVTDPGPNPTVTDPGPNPTQFDPGPNNTTGGPQTLRGILVLDPSNGCISIDSDTGRLDLRFTQRDYSLGHDGAPALVDVDNTAIARSGDTLFVAGYVAGASGTCGTRFDVESLVSVLPAG